jgi:hypothetical protein
MEDKRIKDRKEYFRCSYKEIIKVIASCILFYENKVIDETVESSNIDIKQMKRVILLNEFDNDKLYNMKIINNDDFLNICDNEISSSDYSSTESDNDDIKNDSIVQTGGNLADIYKYRYLDMLKKLNELKFDLV